MNLRTRLFLSSSVAVFLACSHLQASAQIATSDRMFLKDALGMTRFQVEASQLAVSHASNLNIKVYATAMVKRHAAGDLAPLARARGVTPPLMAGTHRKTLNQLAKARGRGFDELYVQKIVFQAQQEEASLLEHASSDVKDAALVEWAAAMLPLVRDQLTEAANLTGKKAGPARKIAGQVAPEKSGAH